MQKIGKDKRKTRSDKKRDVKPTIPTADKETIARIGFLTESPIMKVAETLCLQGLQNREIVDYLSTGFRRDVRFNSTLYLGKLNQRLETSLLATDKKERISIRFYANMHDQLSVLAYALDCTVSKACALLLHACLRNPTFIDGFIRDYLDSVLDKKRMEELTRILVSIQTANPCEEEEYSWAAFLSVIINEAKQTTSNVKNAVTEFVVHKWNQ